MKIPKSKYFNKHTFVAITIVVAVASGSMSCGGRNEVPDTLSEIEYLPSAAATNINAASAAELQKIPYVGEKLALQIIEHRERYGPFRKPEHLILIPGISDSRFRKMRNLIRVE